MTTSSWREVSIKDVAFFQEGPGLRNWQWANDGVKVINGRNVLLDGEIDLANTDKFISSDEFQRKYTHFGIQANDIVVTSSGTLGKVGRIKPEHLPLMMNTSVIRFRSSNATVLSDDYLFFYLRSSHFQDQIKSYAIGSAQKNFGPSHIKLMSMPLPPLLIQQRIAGTLSAYDELIENSQRRIRILETMARALYREWFVSFRFPGHEKVRRIPSAMGAIPEGWKATTFSDITSKIGSGATPRGGKDAYHTDGITLIRSLNIYDYEFELDNLAFIDDLQAADLKNVSVSPNDVLLNITGASVARCALVPSYLLPARVNQHVAIIRANPDRSSPFFILDTINNDDNKRKLLGLAQGGATREALTKETIERFTVVLPDQTTMRRYGAIAGLWHRQRETLQRRMGNLRRTRDLLLPRLMTGNTLG